MGLVDLLAHLTVVAFFPSFMSASTLKEDQKSRIEKNLINVLMVGWSSLYKICPGDMYT